MTKSSTPLRRTSVPTSPGELPASVPVHKRGDAGHFDYDDELHDGLVLPADSMSMAPENLEERVQTTQNRLAQLRAEADALEREKQQFEELSRKQRDFMHGRAEMAEKLGRAAAMLDRETYEAQKRVEQLLVIKDSFNRHLDVVESLIPEQWNSQDLPHDLSRALGMIEDAREEYAKSMSRVRLLTATHAAAAPAPAPSRPENAPAMATMPVAMNPHAFQHWVFCGAAFTLPLAVLGVLFLIVQRLLR